LLSTGFVSGLILQIWWPGRTVATRCSCPQGLFFA
jgi:hypothetical protein